MRGARQAREASERGWCGETRRRGSECMTGGITPQTTTVHSMHTLPRPVRMHTLPHPVRMHTLPHP
eukprot:223368-Chlamydomonas_euryale.AAC.1